MKKLAKFLLIFTLLAAVLTACNDNNKEQELPAVETKGVFICNEGGFTGVGASVQYYDLTTKQMSIVPGLTFASNCQSANIIDNKLFVVDGAGLGAGKVTIMDPESFLVKGVITNLSTPNGVTAVSADRLYVSELYPPFGCVVDRNTYASLGVVSLPNASLQSVQSSQTQRHRANNAVVAQRHTTARADYSPFFYINDWSGSGTQIYKVEVSTVMVVASLTVTVNPNSMVIDRNNKLWVLSDGRSWFDPPHKNATLARVNLETFEVESTYTFSDVENSPTSLTINQKGDVLYFINSGLFTMSVNDTALPTTALIAGDGRDLYSIGIHPGNSDIFVSDVKGYITDGVVYHYSSTGELKAELEVGSIPSTFAFYTK